MGGDEVVGDAPYSTANALSVNMDVLDRVEVTRRTYQVKILK